MDAPDGPEPAPWPADGDGDGIVAGEAGARSFTESMLKRVCKAGVMATFGYGNPGVLQGVGSL